MIEVTVEHLNAKETKNREKITDYSQLSTLLEPEEKLVHSDNMAVSTEPDLLAILKDIQAKVACLPKLQEDMNLTKGEVESLKHAQEHTDGEIKGLNDKQDELENNLSACANDIQEMSSRISALSKENEVLRKKIGAQDL